MHAMTLAILIVVFAGLVCAALVGAWFLAPRAYRVVEVRRLRALCRRKRALCLTFDDGPGERLTRAAMDMVESAGGHATFFMIGQRAAAHPELVADVRTRGHEVGSHTREHLNAWKHTPWRIARDIDAGIDDVESRSGTPGPFRPPYGRVTLGSWAHLMRHGKRPVWWTVDSGDTHRQLPTPDAIVAQLERDGGGVVLIHDFDQDRSLERTNYVLEVTRRVLDWARTNDARVCSYRQLINSDG